ncbi:MAG TPA: lamin tail domain-containing protein, partial [bacterium]|nr:lamin tail domain-containing protein [bacterium]
STRYDTFTDATTRPEILINEFMYSSAHNTASNALEWVELANTTSDTINLKNWRLYDGSVHTVAFDVNVPPYG